VTPAALVTAIVTEQGAARAPFEDVLATHRAAADARRAASSAGFAALLAQRSAMVS
jgi:hypothetical protein